MASLRLPWARRARAIALAAGMLVLAALGLACAVVGLGGVSLTGEAEPGGVSALAARDIPPEYLALYRQAARRYGLDWSILAGIGRVECDHGRDPDPSCGTQGAVNGAGAGGPMQFLASTWESYGVDGDGDGVRDRWDAADAIFSAANYLHASGAPRDYRQAIYAYNHAAWYVGEVERWAGEIPGFGTDRRVDPSRAASGLAPSGLRSATPTQVRLIGGDRAELAPGDGHLALIPVRSAERGAGDGGRGQRAAGAALRAGWAPRSTRSRRRGLLEHGQLRALSLGRAADRGNPRSQPSGPGLCELGRTRLRAAGSRSTRPSSPPLTPS